MAQQYYSLEEAARALGINTEELNRLREKGEIRAFADRGTWKFRKLDVDEAARKQGLGSDPEISLTAASGLHDAVPGWSPTEEPASGSSDSGDQILLSEQELGGGDPGTSSTIIGMTPTGKTGSDSDVRLVIDPGRKPGSDSDVKVVADSTPRAPSDSDVKLVDFTSTMEDSPVRLAPAVSPTSGGGRPTPGRGDVIRPPSDSDVRIVAPEHRPRDSDVKLVSHKKKPGASPRPGTPGRTPERGSIPEAALLPESDSDFELAPGVSRGGEDTSILGGGKQPPHPGATGIAAAKTDSSDITLSPGGSGIGVSSPADSGISLEQPLDLGASDIGLEPSGSSIGTDKTSTIATEGSSEDIFETDFEVPLLEGSARRASPPDTEQTDVTSDSDFELGLERTTKRRDSSSQVIALEGEEEIDESAATTLGEASAAVLETGEGFGEEEEEAAEELTAGVSAPGVPIVRAAPQAEWGALWVSVLGVTTVFLCVAGMMMYDLIRNMSSWYGPNPVNSRLLDWLKGLM